MKNKTAYSLIDSLFTFTSGIFLIGFPLFFVPGILDSFVISKQILMYITLSSGILSWGMKQILQGKIEVYSSILTIPILLFIAELLTSSLLSPNKATSLIEVIPIIIGLVYYFLLIQTPYTKKNLVFLLFSFLIGSTLLSSIVVLQYFHIYIFPTLSSHLPSFTPMGILIDQCIYIICSISLLLYIGYSFLYTDKKKKIFTIIFPLVISIVSLFITIYLLVTTHKPLILPYDIGFQTSFASVSQDKTRLLQGFLFGSGFGTYNIDYARFKPASLNLNPQLWAIQFNQSSSFILEIFATTGILGIMIFFYIIYSIFKFTYRRYDNPLFIPLLVVFVSSAVLPFSFITFSLFITTISFYIYLEKASRENGSYINIFISQEDITPESTILAKNPPSSIPTLLFIFIIAIVSISSFYIVRFVESQMYYYQSIAAIENNNGINTYNLQKKAITLFPYIDLYYRSFSQTNMVLATSLLTSTSSDPKLDNKIKQTAYSLINQAITNGKNATVIAPYTASNWANLGAIYSDLFKVGKNAENFGIHAYLNAVVLDPNNPIYYITLSNLYIQTQNYDKAIIYLTTAISLKPNYGQSYYNLGYAFELKGDKKNAIANYKNAKKYLSNKTQIKKIQENIENIQSSLSQ